MLFALSSIFEPVIEFYTHHLAESWNDLREYNRDKRIHS